MNAKYAARTIGCRRWPIEKTVYGGPNQIPIRADPPPGNSRGRLLPLCATSVPLPAASYKTTFSSLPATNGLHPPLCMVRNTLRISTQRYPFDFPPHNVDSTSSSLATLSSCVPRKLLNHLFSTSLPALEYSSCLYSTDLPGIYRRNDTYPTLSLRCPEVLSLRLHLFTHLIPPYK